MEPELPSSPTDETLFHLAGSRNIAMLDRHAALGRPFLCHSYGSYGFHKAASCGFTDVVAWFLDHGMDVNVHNGDDLTFGLVGARFGYFDILHLFLDRGGSEECLEYLGMNALQRSIFFGESDTDILAMINDAEYFSMLAATTSNFGFQACHFAAHFGRLNLLGALVEAGADPDAASTECLTSFHLAAQRGHFDVMKYLHLVGANVYALSKENKNVAHFAVGAEDVDTLAWLELVSVDMNCVSVEQQSILTCAIEANQYECCRWLLEEGGHHHLLDGYPDVDLTVAFRTQNIPIARLLFSHGARHRDPMTLACCCFHPGLLDLCLEFEAVSDNCGFIALWRRDWDAFDWLVSHELFSWVQTVFQLVRRSLPIDSYHELKRRGFDFHILNEKGQNLLFVVSDPTLFAFLIEEGLDPNTQDVDGNYTWHRAHSEWKKEALVVIGACPQLDLFFSDLVRRMSRSIPLPVGIDIWDTKDCVFDSASLRLLAMFAIRQRKESLMNSVNERYPLALWVAAIVVENGVDTLKEFGFEIDFDELQSCLEERKLTYLLNRCRREKMLSLVTPHRMQLL